MKLLKLIALSLSFYGLMLLHRTFLLLLVVQAGFITQWEVA